MDTIKRYFEHVRRIFKIYSQEEADELGLKYVPWRESKVGDWVLSDDGYVGECLKIYGPYGKKKEYFMSFSFAGAWRRENFKINYLDRKVTRAFSQASTKPWAEYEVNQPRAKRFIHAYVMMFLAGNIDWKRLGLIYRKDYTRIPAKNAQFLFRQEAFQRMIQEKMIEVFQKKGKTEGDILDMLDKSFDMAESVKDPKEMRLVTEDYIKMFDMEPEKQISKEIHYGDEIEWVKGEIEGEIEAAKEQLPQTSSE